eukprot:CAMPEP_0170169578 /NCGR_PEP_ID=MMETSP0040_2-20121228/2471_1 /TAXON_ID=641309 /ORGANISM="Lotharella oceanica, Strain CCMP622" /LENGTH=136 /DNA_ID=CAMNT_0010408379 /DNA_START=11 /DNA_END=421 /DNA_ORIENTATION=-
MTRGNQREVDRARAQARAAKHKKTSKDENKARAKTALSSAEIMRQKQVEAEKRKAAEAEKKAKAEEKKKYIKFIRRTLTDFYRMEAPDKVDNVGKIMEKFAGKWARLQKGLEKTYAEKAPDLSDEAFQKVKTKMAF